MKLTIRINGLKQIRISERLLLALDVSSVNIKHCRLDKNGRYVEDIDSGLNNCLNLEANKDQTGRAFIQDVVLSMLDEGCVALVPVETTIDPKSSNSYQIDSMRTGKITEWYPDMIRVRLYNDRTGEKEEILLPKNQVAIIENPLYAVVNEYNSTMQRLIRKLSLLDVTDEQTASGKLDLIIQLPYVIKTETRREQAERRRKDIIDQLAGSQYGIAYTDGTEKITQLNRSLENNLLKQVEYLTNMVYSQLSITQSVLDGTADEKTMLNYMNRTVEPIISAIVDELKRKFLTKTARSQLQSIVYFRDPFRLVPVNDIAEIADKFTRNEIMTSNEIRQIVGMQPSKDPKADELVNSNISQAKQDMSQTSSATEAYEEGGYSQNG
ncbi:phage portal protein [Blautia massiliensis]|nr:phage portal protein [Blautia massiliensis (ex Durand et al. 2017)]